MKKLAILLMLIGVALVTQAQIEFVPDTGAINTYLSATAADTSSVYTMKEGMAFNVFAWDSAGNDSSAYKVYFDISTNYWQLFDWVVWDSITIGQTQDSTWTPFSPTEIFVPSFPYSRVRAVGQSDNAINSSSQIKVSKSYAGQRR